MTLGLRSGRLLAALCAMAATMACIEPMTLAGPAARIAPNDPRFTLLDPGAPGLIVICSSGGPAAFTATVSPAIGTLLGGGSFTVAAGACVNAWTATPNDARGATISVTQTSGAYINIEATAVPPIGLAYMTVNQTFKNVSWFTNFEHGGSATFFQTAPKKLVLCKEGPAGTYAFSVNAVGGEGNVYPSGASFSIAAGECKDVWTTDAPPPPLDPLVTLIELGSAPLDSIRKVPQDSAAVIVTGSRIVVSQVGYFHGGVVTYFNAFPPPPPPPAATCVAITAVQGFAIAPVTLVGTGGSGGPYTFSATGLPAGLSMSANGTISGTPAVSGTFTYTVTITDSSGRTSTFDCSVTVNAPPSASCVAITAVQGFAITPVTLVGAGGTGGPYTFTATGLPAGLSMSASGTISGTPTVSGTFTYTVTIADSSGRTSTFTCSVSVNAPPSASCVAITAVQGVAITPVSLVGTGGTGGPYTFSATGLPAGLSMSTSGTISGTATVSGTFTYAVTITDNAGRTGTFNCSLSVGPPPPPQVLGIQGCTPGYWKTNPHANSWPATGYARVQLIGSVFTVPSSYTLNSTLMSNYSLLAGLNFQGGSTLSGKAEILLRAAIAGILNAGHPNVAYELTSAQIISSVNSALASANGTTIIDLATRLDLMNNGRGGCPLN